ncbi:MAG: hypothetical protein ABR591_13495 [Candidatus Velthaea sp.]
MSSVIELTGVPVVQVTVMLPVAVLAAVYAQEPNATALVATLQLSATVAVIESDPVAVLACAANGTAKVPAPASAAMIMCRRRKE